MNNSKIVEDFRLIREQCIIIRTNYNTYTALFNDENTDLLCVTAPSFFSDIAEIMQRDWMLKITKLMDPAKTSRKGEIFENLTLKLVNEQLKEQGLMTSEIETLSANILSYGSKLVPARNKRIAHYDREHQIKGITLGETTSEELDQFLSDIQEYCDVVGVAVGLGPLDFAASGCSGDVLDLLKVLERGKNA